MRGRYDLSVGSRLGVGFAIIALVMAAFAAFILLANERSVRAQRGYTERHAPLSEGADRLERSILYVAIATRSFLIDPEPGARRSLEVAIDEARRNLGNLVRLAGSGETSMSFGAMVRPVESYLAQTSALLTAPAPADGAAADAALGVAREAALSMLRTFADAEDARRADALSAMQKARDDVGRAAMGAFAAVMIVWLAVVWFTWRSIHRPTRELLRVANTLRGGDWGPALEFAPAAVAARGERVNPRSELARIAHAFGAAAQALEGRELRLRADARISAVTAATLRREALADGALRAMAETTGAELGILYWRERESHALVPIAHFGVGGNAASLEVDEGLAARAVRDARVFVMNDVARDAPLRLRTGGEGIVPAAIAGVPLVFRDEVLGVAILGATRRFDADTLEFLESAAAQIGIGFLNVRSHEEVQRLLAQVRERNERIQSQNEELHARNEEIQSQLEQIRAQGEQLRAQNEELHAQGEEIAVTNDRLRRQAEELAGADERKNEFLGLLAHELRNPLAAISNCIFMLGHPSATPEQAAHARAVIERQMRHLTRMIDDLLDVTRISRGKMRLQREWLDLTQVVRDGIDDQRRAIDVAGLDLQVDVPAEPVMAVGDRTRLGQVLSNLISNAIKFTDRGRSLRVALRVDRDAAKAALHVIDSGIGMDAKLLERLFVPFSQGEPGLMRGNGGLGLGLALAKALVEMHGGTIEARSEGARMGSEFIVTLPLEGSARAAVEDRTFLREGRQRTSQIVSEDFEKNDS